MIKFLLHLLFLGLLCVGLSGCKHEPPFDPATCGDAQTIEEMKQWVLFKPGTYWIYEEENTGYIDTVAVTEYFDGLSSGGFAAFGCVMHSSFDGYDYDYWFNDSYSGECISSNCGCRRVFCSKSIAGDFFGEGGVYVFPLYQGNYLGVGFGGGNGGIMKVENYPIDVEISDEVYSDCVKYLIENSVQHGWTDVFYSINKNIGVVKKEAYENGEVWNLIDHNIIQ
jgi:hypothetical protein